MLQCIARSKDYCIIYIIISKFTLWSNSKEIETFGLKHTHTHFMRLQMLRSAEDVPCPQHQYRLKYNSSRFTQAIVRELNNMDGRTNYEQT